MKHADVHKRLLLATLDLQRHEIGREFGELRGAARELSRGARSQARTAGTWAAVFSAFWSLRTITRRSRDSVADTAKSGRGKTSWLRTLFSIAVAVRPLLALVRSSWTNPAERRTPPRPATSGGD